MLPPVRAALNSFAEYQNPSQPPLRQRINVANNSASTETVASASLSGGRLDILSLSAQMQLAQGVSIFAETIGKLIKLPRREGEALLEYARRLSEAVKAMNPAERAALERMLNQLVKGISLRLLAEILNNPAGPDAARLALRMETAQLLDRDLAAKAAVSSYRQNAGAEQALNPPPRPANAIPASPDQTTGTNFSSGAEADAPSATQADDAGIPASQRDNAATKVTGTDEASAQRAAPPSVETEAATSASESGAFIPDTETVASSPEESVLQADNNAEADATGGIAIERETAVELAANEISDLPEVLDDEIAESPPAARHLKSGESNVRPASVEGRISPTVFYDGPALARLSQRNPEAVRSSAIESKPALATMTEWLAEVFAEGNSDLLESLPTTARPLPEHQEVGERVDGQSPGRPAPLTKEATADQSPRPAMQPVSEPENPAPAARSAATQTSANGQSAGAPQLPEQFALPPPMPLPLREGVPLPYVPYPPEDREKDPEERKTREISKTDEDGEQQHSPEDQAFHENKSTEDQDEETGEDATDEDAGRANDLYWRMAGWT